MALKAQPGSEFYPLSPGFYCFIPDWLEHQTVSNRISQQVLSLPIQ